MDNTASEYFGDMVEQYDSLMRRAIPNYAEMTERLGLYLPAGAERILELGCGTGNLTLRLLDWFPAATLSCVDAAGEMLDVTRARAGSRASRLNLVESPFEQLDVAPASFDLATSCISLHHVADKAPLYARIAHALRPGGTFVFADQLRGGDNAIHAVNWEHWLHFCRSGDPCSEDEVQSLLEHAAAHDHYTPLAEHFELLRGAGFELVDCVWRQWIWGIVVARLPAR